MRTVLQRWQPESMWWKLVAAGIVVAGVQVGCWGKGNVGQVTGTVKLDGQPLEGALVTFSPTKEGGSSALGKTDSSGAYTLSYSPGVRGAEIGENRVTISTLTSGTEKVPMEYNTQSKLKADVKAGPNKFDWELNGGGPVYSPKAAAGNKAMSGKKPKR